MLRWLMAGTLAVTLCACGRDPAPADAGTAPDTPAPASPAEVETIQVEDVIERDPRYLVGISYPPGVEQHPGLARLLVDYANAARDELMQAVSGLGDDQPAAPYDLALAFTELVSTPRIITIAADGSSYTGGAHGTPLLARFTWLPERGEQLTAAALIPDRDGWELVSRHAREQLATALSQRIEGSGYEDGERAQLLEGGMQMIDQGTAPDPANFDQFEPVLDAGGRISAIRFVFPPYQVGPYSDGVQTVVLPASVLLPVVAPGYRGLFEGG